MGDEAELTPGYKAAALKRLKSTCGETQLAGGFMRRTLRECFGAGCR